MGRLMTSACGILVAKHAAKIDVQRIEILAHRGFGGEAVA